MRQVAIGLEEMMRIVNSSNYKSLKLQDHKIDTAKMGEITKMQKSWVRDAR
jgi:hypothetical protein